MITVDADAPSFDVANLRAFTSDGGLRYYVALSGWLDAGERALVEAVFERLERPRTLDIGVGCGRTVPLLRDHSASYVAIDMGRRMVETTRRLHPGVDVRTMDARRLEFADAAFDVVAFSYNGLDSVTLADRERALAEIARVTRPGGLFAFSSLNRTGPGFGEKFALTRPRRGQPRVTETLRVAAKGAVGLWNYRRNRRFATAEADMAVCTSSAHNYAVVMVAASLTAQVTALARHGFTVERAFSNTTGAAVPLDHDDTEAVWLHYLARRAAPPSRPMDIKMSLCDAGEWNPC